MLQCVPLLLWLLHFCDGRHGDESLFEILGIPD